MNALPNFFLAGAPKAGSTSLYRYLDQHPQIYMSPIKEPHYLADEVRFENFNETKQEFVRQRLEAMRRYLDGPLTEKFSGGHIADWNDYLKLFSRVTTETAVGEASICYLWSPSAPGNMRRLFPDARIVFVLRDPADRAFSQFVHMLSFASRPVSFQDHVDASLASNSPLISELHPFLEFGFYHEQLLRYFALFPREQIYIGFYEDFQRNPVAFIQDIFHFLGVDPAFQPDLAERHMQAAVPQSYLLNASLRRLGLWELARSVIPPSLGRRLKRLVYRQRSSLVLSRADRERLIGIYRQDVQKLSRLLDRDLSPWLASR